MVPKPLQNRSWRGSGGLLGATLETRCFQDLIFDDFGSILGPPLGPVWAHFGHHFFGVFLEWLFDGLGLHLGSQNTSKMRPKRENQDNLAMFRGAENHHFLFFFEPSFGSAFGALFCDFGSFLAFARAQRRRVGLRAWQRPKHSRIVA